MSQTPYRVAPPGFMEEQRQTFEEEGIVVIEDALTNDEVRQYIEAIDRVATTLPEYRDNAYCNPENIVEFDPVFTGLIDHPRHIGFAYDLYGELLKLHQSQFVLRPPGMARRRQRPAVQDGDPKGQALQRLATHRRIHEGHFDRLASIGTEDASSHKTRRIQLTNIVSLLAVFCTNGYSVFNGLQPRAARARILAQYRFIAICS